MFLTAFYTEDRFFRHILLLMLPFFVLTLNAQTPTDQDCLGAIPVCDSLYHQPNSYSGTGNYPNEIPSSGGCPGNCMLSGEKNDVWYRITVQTDGLLGFEITPVSMSNDYDWVVYDLTTARCEDIYSQAAQLQVSCNWSGTSGVTGPNGQSSADCQDAGGTPFNAFIPVNAGESYVINVSNYSSTQSGYTLDFSLSTAQIYDNVRPKLATVYSNGLNCGDNQFDVDFTESVQCSSVTASSFQVVGPDSVHNVTSVYGEACAVGGNLEITYTLRINPPFTVDGTYYLEILPFSAIADACDNIAWPQQKNFNVYLNAPELNEESMQINNSTCGQTNGSITGLEVSGNEPFSYQWLDSYDNVVGDEIDLLNVAAGQYRIVVSDVAGCEGFGGPYQVDDEGAPEIDEAEIGINNNLCGNNNGSITGLIIEGTEPLTYLWKDEFNNPVGSEADLTDMPGGTYNLTVEDANGCEAFAGPYTIENFPSPEINNSSVEITNENCEKENGKIENIIINSSTPVVYKWFDPAGDTIAETPDVYNLGAGEYYLLVRDENSCVTLSEAYLINEIEGPQIDTLSILITNARCEENNGEIRGIEVTGNSKLEFLWTDETGEPIGDTSYLEDLSPGEYSLMVTDSAGCESYTGPFELVNIGGVDINEVSFNNPTCELRNGLLQIEASLVGDKIWYSLNNGVDWQDTGYFDQLQPGEYYVIVKDNNDCADEYTENPVTLVNQGDAVVANAESNSPVCSGSTIELNVDDNEVNVSYSWIGPAAFISNDKSPEITDAEMESTGIYEVIVATSPYDCRDTTTVEVIVKETIVMMPFLTASKNPINPTEEITFLVNISDTLSNPYFEWLIDGDIVASGQDTTYTTRSIITDQTVQCRVMVDYMCADPNPSLSNALEIQVMNITLHIPNTFRPASTIGNNMFRPVTASSSLPTFEMLIFDRWGRQLFKTSDFKEGWDGTIEGKPAPEGTYVWVIKFDVGDENNELHTKIQKGTILLLR